MKSQFVLRSQVRHKFFVRVGSFPAQFVIEMHDAQDDSQLSAQFQQQEQQRDRVGSARNSYANTFAWAHKLLRL